MPGGRHWQNEGHGPKAVRAAAWQPAAADPSAWPSTTTGRGEPTDRLAVEDHTDKKDQRPDGSEQRGAPQGRGWGQGSAHTGQGASQVWDDNADPFTNAVRATAMLGCGASWTGRLRYARLLVYGYRQERAVGWSAAMRHRDPRAVHRLSGERRTAVPGHARPAMPPKRALLCGSLVVLAGTIVLFSTYFLLTAGPGACQCVPPRGCADRGAAQRTLPTLEGVRVFMRRSPRWRRAPRRSLRTPPPPVPRPGGQPDRGPSPARRRTVPKPARVWAAGRPRRPLPERAHKGSFSANRLGQRRLSARRRNLAGRRLPRWSWGVRRSGRSGSEPARRQRGRLAGGSGRRPPPG